MTELKVLNLSVDVCIGGCGGVWFDWYELKKIEERHFAQGVGLLRAADGGAGTEDERACPRCEATSLVHHFASDRRDVRVDDCPNCSGFFLVHGELNTICGQAVASPECALAIEKLLDDLAGEGLASLPRDPDLSQSHEHGVARMLSLLLPDTSAFLD